jgi:hypothetical protein
MKYHYVVDRIRKVVYSCKNTDQLNVAVKYAVLLIVNHFKNGGGDDLSDYVTRRKKEDEMVSWLKMLIRKQKVIIG